MSRKPNTLQTLVMILCNYFPLAHAVGCVCCLVFAPGLAWKLGSFLVCLYLLPPILTRIVFLVHPIRRTRMPMYSADHCVWWFTFCTQTLFLRFPFLEEALRTVPALYSLWLRLWGSKIGKLVYWTPGTTVLDRSFLRLGNHVSFGIGAVLGTHIHVGDEFIIAPISLEDGVTVGARAMIGPGVTVKAGAATKTLFLATPFSVWKDGRRIEK